MNWERRPRAGDDRARRAVRPARRLAFVAVVVICGLLGLAPAAAAAASSRPTVVLVAVPGLSWSDVESMPAVRALAAQSSVGELSVKTAHLPTSCAAGLLAVSAGNRTTAPTSACAIDMSSWPQLAHANATSRYDATIGALGSTLQAHGVRTLAVTAAARPMLANQNGSVDAVAPTLSAALSSALSTGGVIAILDQRLYDVPPALRPAAVAAVDAHVAAIQRALPDGAVLLVAGISDLAAGPRAASHDRHSWPGLGAHPAPVVRGRSRAVRPAHRRGADDPGRGRHHRAVVHGRSGDGAERVCGAERLALRRRRPARPGSANSRPTGLPDPRRRRDPDDGAGRPADRGRATSGGLAGPADRTGPRAGASRQRSALVALAAAGLRRNRRRRGPGPRRCDHRCRPPQCRPSRCSSSRCSRLPSSPSTSSPARGSSCRRRSGQPADRWAVRRHGQPRLRGLRDVGVARSPALWVDGLRAALRFWPRAGSRWSRSWSTARRSSGTTSAECSHCCRPQSWWWRWSRSCA